MKLYESSIAGWVVTESSNWVKYIFAKLMYSKVGMLVQWERDALFNKYARLSHSQSREAKLDS